MPRTPDAWELVSVGALDAVTGGHGKFCMFGAGRGEGEGQRQQNQHRIHRDKLPLRKVSGPHSLLRPPPRAAGTDRPPLVRVPHVPRSSGQGPSPPRRLLPAPAPWQANCTQLFESMQREPAVRRETYFFKCYFNSYAFTFMCLGEIQPLLKRMGSRT